jgi:RNA polymerase sigma-70 factor, ECF subfamily
VEGSSRVARAAGCEERQGFRRRSQLPARSRVDAFFAAARGGNLDALLAVLDPDVVVRADRGAVPAGASRELRGARAVAEQALTFSRVVQFA